MLSGLFNGLYDNYLSSIKFIFSIITAHATLLYQSDREFPYSVFRNTAQSNVQISLLLPACVRVSILVSVQID